MRATEALALMTERTITACLVLDGAGDLAGLLKMQDILRAGVPG